MSQNSKVRLTYPGLRIDRTLSTGLWASVTSGSTVTMSVQVTNYSEQPMTELPFLERVPQGCTVVSAPDAWEVPEGLLWSVTVPAGETVTFTYELKVEGEPGDVIDFSGSNHAGIHSNFLKLTIEAFSPQGEKFRDPALQEAARAASQNGYEFASKLYEAATGKTVAVPTVEQFQETSLVKGEFPTIFRPKSAPETEQDKMILTGWIGGQRLLTEENYRILEARMSDLQAGDIILVRPKLSDPTVSTAWIFDGENLLTLQEGEIVKMGQEELTSVFSFMIFALLRPSLVG